MSDFGNRESDCGQQSKCSSSCSASTLESPRSQSPFESLNENDESGSEGDMSNSDSDSQASIINVKQARPRKKSGRRATWQDSQITDMVDMIVNDDELVRKLIFTNVKKRKNSDAYQKIVPKLNQKYQKAFGKDFPFTVKQMRNKFKWCISTCKKICLTVKTASGVKRFVDSKGYGNWFNLLYPLVKTRDSCKPENAIEPSAAKHDDGDKESGSEDSANKVEGDKEMFVPVKPTSAKRPKMDVIASSLELLQTTIKNDPTKELLQILKDDMQHSREQETRQFNLLCDLIRSNQSQQVPFTGNPHYNVQGNYAPQQLHIPFPHPNVQGAYPPQQSHLPFSQPAAQNVYPPQQSDIPFPHAISQGICAPQHPHMPLSQPSTSSVAHPPDHTYREFNPVTLQNVTTPHKIYDDGTN